MIYVAKMGDIWLHPIASLKGKRRRPMTFDDLRAQGILDAAPRLPGVSNGMGEDEQVSETHETRVHLQR